MEDRKSATKAVEEFLINQKRPKTTRVTQVIQGYESHAFKSKFESWPVGNATGSPGAEEGRGKVAALLKQQGVDLKGAAKSTTPVNEEVPPLLEGGGKLEVWCVDGNAKTALPKEDIGKFYSGDCYIILYTYHSGDKKEEYYLSYWIGKDSLVDDQVSASQITNTVWNSLKGRPVLGRIYQGKEPPQFVALFQPMIILKGGIGSGYKKLIEEKGATGETYTTEGIALIRVSGTSIHNNKTLQVDTVATSLSSMECFILQSGNAMFTWFGNSSTYEQQQWAAKVAEFLKVTEIFNFSQDDLLTEDMMILDTHGEVFIWIGQCVESKEKQKAFDIGQKYVEHANSIDDLSPYAPLYKVMEGNEPCFFKTYFSWDNTKSLGASRSSGNGGPTQRASALAALSSAFNPSSQQRLSNERPKSTGDGPTQRASALAALSNAFNSSLKPKTPPPSRSGQGSQRAAAVAALSSVLTAEQSGSSENLRAKASSTGDKTDVDRPVITPAGPSGPSSPQSEAGESNVFRQEKDAAVDGAPSDTDGAVAETREEETTENVGEATFSYDRLISKSTDPVRGIDYKRREAYLSDSEFQSVFGMTKDAFYRQPNWKQELQKRKADLF
ncbi:Villin-2 [Zea mays]|nr:Villin-2 [Zea mays]